MGDIPELELEHVDADQAEELRRQAVANQNDVLRGLEAEYVTARVNGEHGDEAQAARATELAKTIIPAEREKRDALLASYPAEGD